MYKALKSMVRQIEISEKIYLIAKELNRIEPQKEHYFCEAGANDGITCSNTYKLEEIFWKGILIEPSKKAFEKLVINRKNSLNINCCLGEQNGPKLLKGTFAEGGLMSTVKNDLKIRDSSAHKKNIFAKILRKLKINAMIKENYVIAKSFSEIINENNYPRIDIFTLDVEGFELEVLKGISDEHNPRIMVIETRMDSAFEINTLMLNKGYSLRLCLSNFSKEKNPMWTEDHQDYLWVLNEDLNANKSLNSLDSLN